MGTHADILHMLGITFALLCEPFRERVRRTDLQLHAVRTGYLAMKSGVVATTGYRPRVGR